MTISIIIPAYNEERLLPESLRQVNQAREAFSEQGWQSELIVCDNNSTDRTAELAQAAGAKVVFEPINQISCARNSGAAAACGDWLIFVDADSHPTRELFAEVADQIQSGRVLAGGSIVRLEGNYPIGKAFILLWSAISLVGKLMAGSFIFCEAAAFRQVGGFSHELFAGEEIDLSYRLKQLARATGKRIVILRRHPLLTSARKMYLYTPREHFMFLLRTALSFGRTINNREACHTWYDGRR